MDLFEINQEIEAHGHCLGVKRDSELHRAIQELCEKEVDASELKEEIRELKEELSSAKKYDFDTVDSALAEISTAIEDIQEKLSDIRGENKHMEY